MNLTIPSHAFDFLHIKEQDVQAKDLLTDAGVIESCGFPWSKDAVTVIDRLMEALGRRAG